MVRQPATERLRQISKHSYQNAFLGCLRLRLRSAFILHWMLSSDYQRQANQPTNQPTEQTKGRRAEPNQGTIVWRRRIGRSVGRSLSDSRLLSRSAVACCLLFNGHPGGYPDERRRGPRVLHSVRSAHSPPHPFGLSSAFGVCAPSANPQARDGKK